MLKGHLAQTEEHCQRCGLRGRARNGKEGRSRTSRKRDQRELFKRERTTQVGRRFPTSSRMLRSTDVTTRQVCPYGETSDVLAYHLDEILRLWLCFRDHIPQLKPNPGSPIRMRCCVDCVSTARMWASITYQHRPPKIEKIAEHGRNRMTKHSSGV